MSLFRPSDDAAILPFLVPANHYAAVTLRQLAELHRALGNPLLAADCVTLANEVSAALRAYGTTLAPSGGRVWAYEVDGFGSATIMDDANVPSLLSLPYLGCCSPTDPLYLRTRDLVLSAGNPWFHRGRAAEGIGSPHTPGNRIWPISIMMRALTSTSDAEVASSLKMLAATDAGTGFMHEAFDADDPSQYSRPWFAWANSLFGELMLNLARNHPGAFDLLS